MSLDRDWRFTYLNSEAERLLAASREQVLGKRIWDHFPETAGSIFEHQYREAMTSGCEVKFEACHPPLDTWVEVHAYPSRDGLEIQLRDITPGMRAAESLRRWARVDEVRFRALVEHSADIVGLLNADGTVRYANKAVERVLGYAPETLIGRSAFQVVHPDDLPQLLSLFEGKGERLDGAMPIECRLRHADGSWRNIELTGNHQLHDPDIVGLVVSARDVTERYQTATALAAARRQLAASREAERLRLARELHDGPVQDLLAVSYELARESSLASVAQPAGEPGSTLERQRGRLLAVVGQLRGVVGELRPPGLTEFGLPTALNGFVTELQREAGDALPAIRLEVDEQAANVPQAMAITIFRIVQESVRNALRHAEAREITIEIRREREPSSVEVQVRDDGRGFVVPERLADFARAGHFGLVGLVERVEQADGQVAVTSSPGRGTVLTVRVPVADVRESDERIDSRAARR
jgi:PAS domain S-box-containing protein